MGAGDADDDDEPGNWRVGMGVCGVGGVRGYGAAAFLGRPGGGYLYATLLGSAGAAEVAGCATGCAAGVARAKCDGRTFLMGLAGIRSFRFGSHTCVPLGDMCL